MPPTSPLGKLHMQAEAEFTTFPPPGSVHAGDSERIEIVATFGDPAAEHLAIRQGAGLMDLPHRAVIVAQGADRAGFLNRMLTQELSDLQPWRSVRSFWLNRKGRIQADLRVIALADWTLLDLDAAVAERTMGTLADFIIADDVVLKDASEELHSLAVHGPGALELVRRAVGEPITGAPLEDFAPGAVALVKIAGAEVVLSRQDSTGEVGVELLAPMESTEAVFQHLLEASASLANEDRLPRRTIGFDAYNVARVEAGRPMFLIDFGANSLPHETGALRDRVSFTKGCYLGQEIVARLESLGQPKQQLVALRIDSADPPAAGERLFQESDVDSDAVGVITSAVSSPLLEGAALCYAQVKTACAHDGTKLILKDDTSAKILPRLSQSPAR